jgi:hypothetical protein
MPAGFSVAIALLAQTSSATPADPATAAPSIQPTYGPAPAAPPTPVKQPVKTADDACAAATAKADARHIVICAQRPQGYRLNPDVTEAKREMRSGGRPRPPESRTKDNSCATVGPFGCVGGPTIDLVNAAVTLATMATKAVKGENVGKMFITDPQPTEYQLYLEAKRRREAREAEEAVAAKVKAMQAASKAVASPAETRKETPAAKQ